MDTLQQHHGTADVLDRVPVGLLFADSFGRATMTNTAWRTLTGQDDDSWRDNGWMRAGPADELAIIVGSRRPYASDWEVATTSGPPRILHVRIVPDEVDGVIVSALDVTDERRETSRLLQRAAHDPLTGLINRAQFIEFLGHALERHRRDGSMMTAVLFVDVDDFKSTNDVLGHQAGDHLLRELASHISGVLRPSDIVARYGGDEFTVLCEDLGGPGEAQAIADRLRQTVARVSDHHRPSTLSVGLVLVEDPTLEPLAIIDLADRMMYRDKERRRGESNGAVGPEARPVRQRSDQ